MHKNLSSHLVGYLRTDPPEINLPLYLHASLWSNHKDLPVTTTTCVHFHRCTRSGPYVFIFILSFRLTVKILSVHGSIVLHVYRCTCSSLYLYSLFLLFRDNLHNALSTHLLGYLPTDPPEKKFTSLPSCFSFV